MIRSRRLWLGILGFAAAWWIGVRGGGAWYREPLDLFHTILMPRGEEGKRPPGAMALADSRVVLVDVSVDSGEGSPIAGRPTLARLFDKLAELGAWAIGVDILFEDPTDPRVDAALAASIKKAGCVVLATRYDTTTLKEVPSRFASSAACLGVANVVADGHDGYIRTLQHYYDQPGIVTRYSLTLQLARMILAGPGAPLPEVDASTTRVVIKAQGGPVELPVDTHGTTLIQYLGPAGTIPQVPWRELLALDRSRLDLRGRVVLVGDTRLVTRDAYLTSFHRGARSRISGVEVHAQNLLGMLTGSRRRLAGSWADWVSALVAVLGGCLLALRLSVAIAPIAGLGVLLAAWWGSWLLFDGRGIFVNPLPFTFSGFVALTGGLIAVAHARRATEAEIDEREFAPCLALLDESRWAEAVDSLQKLVPVEGGEPPNLVRWGLALAFLGQNDVPLALTHVDGLKPDSLPVDRIYRLALALEQAGVLREAETQFRHVLAKNVSFCDAATRAQELSSRDPRVPDELRRLLVHRYRDVSFVAGGGMGRIYRAFDQVRGTQVAIKVPDPVMIQDAAVRKRFHREIETLAKLDHPNIVRLHDVGPIETPYYAMELVSGESLEELLRRVRFLDCAKALSILKPVADALEASHRAGIVHRDIKPANILVDAQEVPHLTDFGLAYLEDRTRLTRMSVNVGTPAYMSPEQLQGSSPAPTMDVYAFGVVLFEALTGRSPYRSAEALSKLVDEAIPLGELVPDIPVPLEDLVSECLARNPDDRPADGRVLANRLARIMTSMGLPTNPPS